MVDDVTVALLAEVSANAVPAETYQQLDGWRLRFAPDGRLRTSSVFVPPGTEPLAPAEATRRIELAEEFYARRGAPARFQLCDRGSSRLDAALAARGYATEAPVAILVADLHDLAAALSSRQPPAQAVVTGGLTAAWREAYAALTGVDADRAAERTATFGRVGPPIGFASAAPTAGAGVAAIGISVAERGWAGFFTIETAPSARRQGLATAVMAALTEWALGLGQAEAYLQVEAGNRLAEEWYRRLGFVVGYRYWYRSRPAPA